MRNKNDWFLQVTLCLAECCLVWSETGNSLPLAAIYWRFSTEKSPPARINRSPLKRRSESAALFSARQTIVGKTFSAPPKFAIFARRCSALLDDGFCTNFNPCESKGCFFILSYSQQDLPLPTARWLRLNVTFIYRKTLCKVKPNAQSYILFSYPLFLNFHSLLTHLLRFESAACLLVADGISWRQRVSHNFFSKLRSTVFFAAFFSKRKRVLPRVFLVPFKARSLSHSFGKLSEMR